jgi:hypothetical protein
MLKTKAVQFSIPGWISVSMEPNEAERKAAWTLYVELSTRIATQPFSTEAGRLRTALSSLYLLFDITRGVLRDGGPALASGRDAFGPIAIRFLTEVLAPFTTKWHEPLLSHELSRPKERDEWVHERDWVKFDEMIHDLRVIQENIQGYVRALGQVAGIKGQSN